jgi:hypothetical protein
MKYALAALISIMAVSACGHRETPHKTPTLTVITSTTETSTTATMPTPLPACPDVVYGTPCTSPPPTTPPSVDPSATTGIGKG